jgi:hypothetical protein
MYRAPKAIEATYRDTGAFHGPFITRPPPHGKMASDPSTAVSRVSEFDDPLLRISHSIAMNPGALTRILSFGPPLTWTRNSPLAVAFPVYRTLPFVVVNCTSAFGIATHLPPVSKQAIPAISRALNVSTLHTPGAHCSAITRSTANRTSRIYWPPETDRTRSIPRWTALGTFFSSRCWT